MTGIFHNLLWSCFLLSVATGKVLPPENIRLSWRESLYPELTWTPPKHSLHNCLYLIQSTVKDNGDERPLEYEQTSLHWKEDRVLNGGFLNVSIQTVCNGSRSEAEFVGLNDEDLKLDCWIRSSSQVHCSWTTPPSAQLQLFYNVALHRRSTVFSALQECPLYTDQRRGCELPVKTSFSHQDLSVLPINLLLNGTLGSRTIRNIHHISSLKLKLPPLNWTVTESKEHFLIDWTAPAFNNLSWRFVIDIKACDKHTHHVKTDPPFKFHREADCPYDISLRGRVENFGGTEGSEKHFDAASDPNLVLLVLILIPLVLAVLVVLTLFWCRKNKDKMWPKVPQPNPELFKDLINNNNKTNFHSPKAEEECVVTLVVEPKQPGL